jgi:hypothetical protein
MEKELHDSIKFLDLTLHREKEKLLYIFNKQKANIDIIIIPNDSCHPYEHKFPSSNYLLNTGHNYPITKEAKETELNTIKCTVLNNQYNINHINKHPVLQKQNVYNDSQQQKTK